MGSVKANVSKNMADTVKEEIKNELLHGSSSKPGSPVQDQKR